MEHDTPHNEQLSGHENVDYLDSLKVRAHEATVERSIEQITYFLNDRAKATIPSFENGVTHKHDYQWHLMDDISTYQANQFYKILKQFDQNNEVTINDPENTNFTTRDVVTYDNLSNELYIQIQAALQENPVYTALKTVSEIITSARGTVAEISLETLNLEESYILLRILGLTPDEITSLAQADSNIPLPHLPGLNIKPSPHERNVSLTYGPRTAAEIEVRKTFLWSQTGEEIALGLGQKHLSPRLENSLSEGGIAMERRDKFSNRYGNGYADITRLLSTCIGRDLATVKLQLWDDEDHRISNDNTKHWRTLSQESTSAPVREFFRLLYAVCTVHNTEFESPEMTNDIPQFNMKQIVSYRDGSCKDAETYYCGASPENFNRSSSLFLEKVGRGVNTALVLSPISVGGVLLQPGHLVKLSKDADGAISAIQPLRPTMFMFSEEEARDAFGSQYEDTCNNLDRKHVTPLTNLTQR